MLPLAKTDLLCRTAIAVHIETWDSHEKRFHERAQGLLESKSIEPDESLLDEIAKKFRVTRTLSRQERKAFYDEFFHEFISKKPIGKGSQVRNFRNLVEFLKEKKAETKKLPASLATKVFWFFRPEGWTMYDNLAANALRTPRGKNSLVRMESFYAKVYDLKFDDFCENLRKVSSSCQRNEIWPERIFDKLLWLVGDSLQSPHSRLGSNETNRILKSIPESELEDMVISMKASTVFKRLEGLSLP